MEMASVSKTKRREKAIRRRQEAEARHRANFTARPCPRCGEQGPHFVPPSFGDIGFYTCDPPADIRNHTRCRYPYDHVHADHRERP